MKAENVLHRESSRAARFNRFMRVRQRWRRVVAPFMLLCAALALQTLAGVSPAATEHHYSRGLYPHIARGFAFVNKSVSFSIAEAMMTALLMGLIGLVAWQVRQIYLRRARMKDLLLSTLLSLMWVTGAGMMLFLLLWGLNYQRQLLSENLHFERREASASEVEAISRRIISGMNRDYEKSRANRAIAGSDHLPLTRSQLYQDIEASFQHEALLIDARGNSSGESFGPPKAIYFSGLISRLGISGIYSPFTGEANFNAAQPDFDLPFTMAHEMAHGHGFAREDEANFIAFLVCTKSSHPYVRYSGYLNSLRILGALARVAPERYRAVVATLGDGPRADLKARTAFWQRYTGRLSAASHQFNNAYLKANRVRSGVKNYNEAVALIIGYYLSREKLADDVDDSD